MLVASVQKWSILELHSSAKVSFSFLFKISFALHIFVLNIITCLVVEKDNFFSSSCNITSSFSLFPYFSHTLRLIRYYDLLIHINWHFSDSSNIFITSFSSADTHSVIFFSDDWKSLNKTTFNNIEEKMNGCH